MHIALLVSLVGWELEQAARRIFRPHGLSPAQFNVLHLLSDQPKGLPASALARQLVVDPSNITRLLERLVRDRLIREVDSHHDARHYVVALTPAGQERWAAANRSYQKALAAVIKGLPADKLAQAESVLFHLQEQSHAVHP